MFAFALTLVVLVSTAVLLYQYWSGSLLIDDGAEAKQPAPEPLPSKSLSIDHAA